MKILSIKISAENLNNVQKKLITLDKRARYALQKGTNKTATLTKRRLREELKSLYTIKDVKYNKNAKIKRATLQDLTASLYYKGRATPLPHFKVKPRTPNPKRKSKTAASALIMKDKQMKKFEVTHGGRTYKAFVANLANGNTMFASRTPEGKIKTFYSASYPNMIKNKKVYDVVEPEIIELLQNHVSEQLERYLSY